MKSDKELATLFLKLYPAVKKLYYAAYWYPDRPCKAKQLWEDVRDAAGFQPGDSPSPYGDIE
jgi:hypothetical protein